jgi:hypothetical protein
MAKIYVVCGIIKKKTVELWNKIFKKKAPEKDDGGEKKE